MNNNAQTIQAKNRGSYHMCFVVDNCFVHFIDILKQTLPNQTFCVLKLFFYSFRFVHEKSKGIFMVRKPKFGIYFQENKRKLHYLSINSPCLICYRCVILKSTSTLDIILAYIVIIIFFR